MIKRTCIILLVVLALSLNLIAPAAGAVFSDIPDQETQTAVALLQNLGIINGFSDGTFRPGDSLTRAQFCTIAVLLSGVRDVTAYEGFTIFPDVRGNYWARGYINAAVRELKVVTGFPDGTFKPDVPVTFAQAVTALMRLLGFTDSDVGMNWPQGYLTKANQIGLTKGVNLGANDNIPRGAAARMAYNAIFTSGKDGSKYSDALGFKEQNVIVLRLDGTSPDGKNKGLVTIGGDGFYPYRAPLSIEEGARGSLLVDGDGYALSFTPDQQTKREVRVSQIGPMSVTGPDGSKVDNIPSSAVVYTGADSSAWGQCWIDIPVGAVLRFFFTGAGAIDYIFLSRPGDSINGVVKIIATEPDAGRNPLPGLGIDANAQVFKNGVAASWSNLRLNDVLIYDDTANIVSATDFRITGVYENALPSREAPDQVVTLGGRNFSVLPDARAKLAARKIGDTLTFLFTADDRVADVRSGGAQSFQPGIVAGDSSVELYNGMTISGAGPLPAGFGAGTPVMACMPEAGKLNLQPIQLKSGIELDISNMTVGASVITPYAVFIDQSGRNGSAVFVDRMSLPDTVAAGKVLSINYESGGRANLILLNNVTGDAWLYGLTAIERGRSEEMQVPDGQGGWETIVSYLPNLAYIDNQNGRQTFEDPGSLARNSGDNAYGLAIGTNGNVIASAACTRVNNIRRTDFSGNTLMVSGIQTTIPGDLQVYIKATGEYVAINEARLYSNNFTVFLDKPAADGGKVRFIMAL